MPISGSKIEEGAVIDESAIISGSTIHSGAVVGAGATVTNSIILGNIGPKAYVTASFIQGTVGIGVILTDCAVRDGAVVGPKCSIDPGAIVESRARIGENSHISRGARICSGVQIGKNVSIGSYSIVHAGMRVGDYSRISDHAVLRVCVGKKAFVGYGVVLTRGVVDGGVEMLSGRRGRFEIQIRPLGTDGRVLSCFLDDRGELRFSTGCFEGDETRFRMAIHIKHRGSELGRQYLAAIEFAKQVLKGE